MVSPWDLTCNCNWLWRKNNSSLGHMKGELSYGASATAATHTVASTACPLPTWQRRAVTVHPHTGQWQQTHSTGKISVVQSRVFIVQNYQRSEWMYRELCSASCWSSVRFPVLPPRLSSFFPRSLRSALRIRGLDELLTPVSKVKKTSLNVIYNTPEIAF